MLKKLLVLLIALIPFAVSAQSAEGTAAGSITLYNSHSSQAFRLNSDEGWKEIRQIFAEDFNAIQPPLPGMSRKWRVVTSYVDESSQIGQSTLQVKLGQYNSKDAVFTLPWTEKASRWQEKESNWFIPYSGNGMIMEGTATLSVRLVAPPRSAAPGKVYKIELEAWDFPSDEEIRENTSPTLQMAFSSPAELMVPNNRELRSLNEKQNARSEAQDFALKFIESKIDGNLPAFYKALSNDLKVLETGYSLSRYRIAPPASDLSRYTMADYKRNYRYHIYSYDEYAELFPQWFEPGRRWSPDRSCYLFLGTEVLPGRSDFMAGENLVFMLKQVDGQWSIIALPE
ncbi:MAG: hypothetical protein PQJ58_12280 [Spirochaetales bacterium]|nr:hypothetical protein [Spirochaetales bacterium]